MKLIMTKGLPGSGKTTWAKQYLKDNPNTVLVCKDDLRAMMFNSAWSGGREKVILKVRDYVVSEALKEGKNVVVHDTNFNPIHETNLRVIALKHRAEFEIKDLTDIPLDQCIHNDLCREDSVGEKVIRKMYKDFIKPKPPKIEYQVTLPDAIICDIDGTLALFGDANPYDRDFFKDEVNMPIAHLLSRYSNRISNYPIILVSGRKDKYRDQTEMWLKNNNIYYNELFMRKTLPEGERDPKDVIVKEEIYNTHIKGKFNVLFVLDDRDQVVEFWRSQGLTCLQVAEGDF